MICKRINSYIGTILLKRKQSCINQLCTICLKAIHWLLSKDGSRSSYDIGIEVNSIGFLFGKFLRWLVFMLGLGVAFGMGCIGVSR